MSTIPTSKVFAVADDLKGLKPGESIDTILLKGLDRTGIYQRGPDTFTGPLPLRRHVDYARKGWLLVEVC